MFIVSVFSVLLCILFCINITSVLGRPIDDKLRQDMTEALEEDYYNLAALWSLVNDYYEENKNFDSVECLE